MFFELFQEHFQWYSIFLLQYNPDEKLHPSSSIDLNGFLGGLNDYIWVGSILEHNKKNYLYLSLWENLLQYLYPLLTRAACND